MGLVLVKNLEQIRANIKTVANNLKPSVEEVKREFYLKLVKNGSCFVVDKFNGTTVFAPSRFIGYVENNEILHDEHKKGKGGVWVDGRETNKEIEKVIKALGLKNWRWMTEEDSGYKKLEDEYESFVELCLDKDKVSSRTRKYIDLRRGAR